MKIALLILCFLFLKTSAGAQDWRKITPDSVMYLKGMEVVYTDDGMRYILAYSDTTLFITSDEGQTWVQKKSYVQQCVFPPYEPIQYFYGSVKAGPDKTLYITYDGFDCGSIDGTQMILVQTHLDSIQKDTWLFEQKSGILCNPYVKFANVDGKFNYLYYDENMYYFENTISSLADFPVPDPDNKPCGPLASKVLALDSRDTSTLYFSLATGDDTSRVDNLFKKSGSSGDWELVSQLPFDNDDFLKNRYGAFYDIAFLQSGFAYFATNAGLLRLNTVTGIIDAVLQEDVTSVAASNQYDGIFAATKAGHIFWGETNRITNEPLGQSILDLDVYSPYGEIYALTSNGIWELEIYINPDVREEDAVRNALSITPNPANTSLKISFLKTDLPQQLSVYNSLGQLVFKTEFSGEFVWDFKNDVPDGVYTVAVQSGGKSVAKQVVILR